MKCQILFSGKNKKNISKCCLLKFLSRVLSVNEPSHCIYIYIHTIVVARLTRSVSPYIQEVLSLTGYILAFVDFLFYLLPKIKNGISFQTDFREYKKIVKINNIKRKHQNIIFCLFVLRFYSPVNPMGSCQARSVYLTTCLLGRLSLLSC